MPKEVDYSLLPFYKSNVGYCNIIRENIFTINNIYTKQSTLVLAFSSAYLTL